MSSSGRSRAQRRRPIVCFDFGLSLRDMWTTDKCNTIMNIMSSYPSPNALGHDHTATTLIYDRLVLRCIETFDCRKDSTCVLPHRST
jgi:hypothetical protein